MLKSFLKSYNNLLDSLRLSDSSFSSRLSEVGSSDATFTLGNLSGSTGAAGGLASPDRSQSNSQAVDDPSNSSSLPNAFPSDSSSSEAPSSPLSPVAVKKTIGASTKSQSDVNHNTSNGCPTGNGTEAPAAHEDQQPH